MSISSTQSDIVHVVAGVICNAAGEVLLAQRPAQAHLGGLWEFPGGKLNQSEAPFVGLVRELREELGIELIAALPLIQVPYEYPEKRVLLDVWEVKAYQGMVHGREGQPLVWVSPDEFGDWPMPPADVPIVSAIRLPECYLITPEPGQNLADFVSRLNQSLERGISMVQLRAKHLNSADYESLARKVMQMCEPLGVTLLLNHEPEMVERVGAHGVHLTSKRLKSLHCRPLEQPLLAAASCHSLEELQLAQALKLDFAVLGPVARTVSHPEASPIGWRRFAEWVAAVSLPVYALGGMTRDHIETSRRSGGQGIAAIGALWV